MAFFNAFKGLKVLNQMLAALHQHLDLHVIRDELALYQVRKKSYSICDAAEANLDLKPSFTEGCEHLHLLLHHHRLHKGLVAILKSTLHHMGAFIISLFGHVRSGNPPQDLLYL